jgi:hypothetical protein
MGSRVLCSGVQRTLHVGVLNNRVDLPIGIGRKAHENAVARAAAWNAVATGNANVEDARARRSAREGFPSFGPGYRGGRDPLVEERARPSQAATPWRQRARRPTDAHTLSRLLSSSPRRRETLSSVVGGPFDDRWHAPWHALAGNRASRRKCAQSSGRFRRPATPGNGWTTALGEAGADTASALRPQASQQRRANRRRVRSGAFRRPGEAGACS